MGRYLETILTLLSRDSLARRKHPDEVRAGDEAMRGLFDEIHALNDTIVSPSWMLRPTLFAYGVNIRPDPSLAPNEIRWRDPQIR